MFVILTHREREIRWGENPTTKREIWNSDLKVSSATFCTLKFVFICIFQFYVFFRDELQRSSALFQSWYWSASWHETVVKTQLILAKRGFKEQEKPGDGNPGVATRVWEKLFLSMKNLHLFKIIWKFNLLLFITKNNLFFILNILQ